MTITKAANGYIVETDNDSYIFKKLSEALKFIKDNMGENVE